MDGNYFYSLQIVEKQYLKILTRFYSTNTCRKCLYNLKSKLHKFFKRRLIGENNFLSIKNIFLELCVHLFFYCLWRERAFKLVDLISIIHESIEDKKTHDQNEDLKNIRVGE